jgi:hypothetical protein
MVVMLSVWSRYQLLGQLWLLQCWLVRILLNDERANEALVLVTKRLLAR